MLTMMPWSLLSTSSNVQWSLSLFCDISKADVATPPAFEALPGANNTPFAWRYSVASIDVGMLAPSATATTPFATSAFASSIKSSFCVAHGRAMSTLTVHTPFPSWYCAEDLFSAYSVNLARCTSFTSFSNSTSIPSGSYTQPVESDTVTTFAPSCWAFCAA